MKANTKQYKWFIVAFSFLSELEDESVDFIDSVNIEHKLVNDKSIITWIDLKTKAEGSSFLKELNKNANTRRISNNTSYIYEVKVTLMNNEEFKKQLSYHNSLNKK